MRTINDEHRRLNKTCEDSEEYLFLDGDYVDNIVPMSQDDRELLDTSTDSIDCFEDL